MLSTFTVSVLAGHNSAGTPVYVSLPSQAAFQYDFYIACAVFVGIAITIVFAHEVLGNRKST